MSEKQRPQRTRSRPPTHRPTTGFRVADAWWNVLEPRLPVRGNPPRVGGGRPRVAERRGAEAIFYVRRTGGQWSALTPTHRCAQSTAYDRFQEGGEAGVFLTRWPAGVDRFDQLQGMDWSWLRREGARSQTPRGGEKDGADPDRSRHARRQPESVDGGTGPPARGGHRGGEVPRLKRGRTPLPSIRIERPAPTAEPPPGRCVDKGYDDDEVRAGLQEVGVTAHLRARGVDAQARAREAGTTARRGGVERRHR